MPSAFTHHWKIDTWNLTRRLSDHEPFKHTGGGEFRRRGVEPGDLLFGITVIDGKMYVGGWMRVNQILTQKQAERYLGRSDLWEALEHCVCEQEDCSRLIFDLVVPDPIARRLRFESGGEPRPLVFTPSGAIDKQTLRGVRRLTSESADLLQQLVAEHQQQNPVRLRHIETLEELSVVFDTFQRDGRKHRDRAKTILRATTYWVYDTNSGAFGPGKFLGYADIDFLQYELAGRGESEGTKFDGYRSRVAIEDVVGSAFKPDTELIQLCQDWGEGFLGNEAFGNARTSKWRFVAVALAGRGATSAYPDEVTQPERYAEGAVKTVTVNVYERNDAARRACIAHYQAKCFVCELVFPERYGGLGEGFIHVHHLKPMAEIGEEYEIDPVKDLRPVCPNCHAMLHYDRNPPYTIEEMRARLRATPR